MWEFDTLSDYVKAAARRLDDARELLEPPTWEAARVDAPHRHLRAAVYLAGYAVECALKAYIISRVAGARTFAEVLDRQAAPGEAGPDLRGRRSHNIRVLRGATDLDAALADQGEMARAWECCQKWTPDLRYNPAHFTSRRLATEFVEAAARLHACIETQRVSGDEEA